MNSLIQRLKKDKDTDFRFIPFGVVFLYILSLILSELFLDSYAVLGTIFRIHPIPYFVDLEILLCGVDAIRNSIDPYHAPCFEGEAYFNYPYLWGFLSIIPFMTVSNHIIIGFTLCLLFFISLYFFIGKINFKAALIYSLIFISPAVMLGVERGNSDLIIFLFLSIIPLVAHKSKIWSSLLILIASMLKIFPIGAVLCLFNFQSKNIRKSILLIVGIILLFMSYVIFMIDNIIMVSEKTPRPFKEASYGLGGLPAFLNTYFKIEDGNTIFIFLGFTLICLSLFLIFFKTQRSFRNQPIINRDKNGVAFLMGSGIFLLTCLIGFNWEYRLIFLIFTIPQILKWSSDQKRFKILLLTPYLLLIWCSLIMPVLGLVLPDGLENITSYVLNILLFFGYLYVILIHFEKIIRESFKLNPKHRLL